MNKPKYIQTTGTGYTIAGNRGNRDLSVSFKVTENLRLQHKYNKTVYHTANAWKYLTDSQKYKRVVSQWIECDDMRLTKEEVRSNYEPYWAYVDKQIEALNVIVRAYNSTEPVNMKRYFSRSEPLSKMLYTTFLLNQDIDIKQVVEELEAQLM